MTVTDNTLCPSKSEINAAKQRISKLLHRTPLLSSNALSQRIGNEVWLKAENFQKTGSFKPRGVFNKMLQLKENERENGVITASAGNNGQAVAYAAAHENMPGYVVMPKNANQSKVAAVRDYGATAILHGNLWDDAYAHSLLLAKERSLTYFHPFKDRDIIAGQGTIGLEILEEIPDVNTVLVPIGGGGLIAGISTTLKLFNPTIRVIGVEPEGSANFKTSHETGNPVDLKSVSTLADGLATQQTDEELFRIIEANVDNFVTVSDDAMLSAIKFLLERTKLLSEVSGAATTAALLSGAAQLPPGTKTVAVISGGNFDVSGKLALKM